MMLAWLLLSFDAVLPQHFAALLHFMITTRLSGAAWACQRSIVRVGQHGRAKDLHLGLLGQHGRAKDL